MTQPNPPENIYAAVLATAATAYALIAVEARIREEVEEAIADAFAIIAALATVAVATPAAVAVGIQLMANAYFYDGFTKAIATARRRNTTSIQAGYEAATYIAHRSTQKELASLGYTVPEEIPELGDMIDRITADVDTMWRDTQATLQTDLVAAYDGIQGDDPTPARIVALNQALQTAQNRITQRATATAATAVHQGAADAQQAIYNEYQTETGTPGLMKRWRTTAADPCGMCAALDGTMVGINGEFDHDASDNQQDWRPVWRNLQGPPRHPNCRCQIELVAT